MYHSNKYSNKLTLESESARSHTLISDFRELLLINAVLWFHQVALLIPGITYIATCVFACLLPSFLLIHPHQLPWLELVV